MTRRLLQLTGTVLLIGVALVTPAVVVTSTPASGDTVVNGCTIVSNPTSTNFTNCPGVDLAGANLSGIDLSYANLAGAKFIDCSVPNTNPCPEADVRLSNLSGADLSIANLSSAALEGTNLSSANLSSANLTGADLVFCAVFPPAGSEFCPSASLADATLTGANFTNATLGACGTAPGGSSACGAVNFTGTLLVPADQTVSTTNPNGAVVTWATPPSLPGATPGTCTPASGSTFPVTPNSVICQVLDDHGNAASGSFTVTVNGPPTTVSLSSSTNPSVLGEQVTFTATVSPDPGGGAVTFFDNRTQTSLAGCSAVPLSGGSATCSTTFNVTGTHDIQAFYGEGTSPILTQVVGPLPTTSVLIPSDGATISGAKALLDAAASSAVGITSVSYNLTGGTLSNQHIAWGTPTLYGYLAQWDTTSVPNGTYTLQTVATDVDGASTTSAPITITVSNPRPATAVLIPSNGATLSGSSQPWTPPPRTPPASSSHSSAAPMVCPVIWWARPLPPSMDGSIVGTPRRSQMGLMCWCRTPLVRVEHGQFGRQYHREKLIRRSISTQQRSLFDTSKSLPPKSSPGMWRSPGLPCPDGEDASARRPSPRLYCRGRQVLGLGSLEATTGDPLARRTRLHGAVVFAAQ